MGWTQTGRNPETDGKWAGTGSKANFKSRVEIISPEGTKIPFDSTEDGIYSWESIQPKSEMEWEIDTDGKSDRAELRLTYFDMKTFITQFNRKMDSLTETQLQKIESGDTEILEDITQQTINTIGMDNLFIGIWSDVVSTGEDGTKSGKIVFEENWPENTIYLFSAHYGYDEDAESSNWSKTGSFIYDIGTIAVLFIPVVGQVVGGAMFLGEMAYYGSKFVASGYGASTKNKYDKYFPTAGFNHTYMFYVGDPEITPQDYVSSIMSDENLNIVEKLNLLAQFYGVVKVGLLVGGGILVMGLLKRR